MIKLAFAIGFLAVFGMLAWLAFVWVINNFFTKEEPKKEEEKPVDTSKTTTDKQ